MFKTFRLNVSDFMKKYLGYLGFPLPTNAKPWIPSLFSEFIRGRSVLTDECKEGRPKQIAVPQNVDAVRELVMQDRHVTCRELKASLGIKVFEEIRKNNRQRTIILHRDDAGCHTSAEIARFLEGQRPSFWVCGTCTVRTSVRIYESVRMRNGWWGYARALFILIQPYAAHLRAGACAARGVSAGAKIHIIILTTNSLFVEVRCCYKAIRKKSVILGCVAADVDVTTCCVPVDRFGIGRRRSRTTSGRRRRNDVTAR
ncbi:hypothetical protein EVAR_23380_1 [Eumeta japonica]|uniref:Histone-lysine N-methyltransferase SETMAR n=1 Tax=Eumeta variegata TaxID=151549 RepID=A0A4C1VWK7_EUMVA|nr:hypothetical protein EVAR_23380_1 [Eumeta japonica]